MWQFVKGCVIIRVNGRYPERLLNQLRESGVPVRRVYGERRGEITLSMPARDFRRIRPLVRTANCRVHIVSRSGAPFAVNRLWRRPVLWIGALLIALGIAVSSTRIMHIVVDGCTRIPETLVLRALEEQGIRRFGAYPESTLRNAALQARLYDERIAWISMILSGSCLYVNVTEAEERVVTTDPDTPCDVVAVKDGVVTGVVANEGFTKLAPGDRVRAGDILIQGEFFPETNEEVLEPMLVHARGRILANVYYVAEYAASPMVESLVESGSTAPYRRVSLCGVVLYETPPPFAEHEVRDIAAYTVTDCMLPVTVLIGTYAELVRSEAPRSRSEQTEEALVGAEQLAYLKIPKDAVIVDKQQRTTEIGGVIVGIVGVVTEESIGLERKIVH